MIIKKKIYFIPDYNKISGLGHFYRCLSYSKFFKNRFDVYFLLEKNSFTENLYRKKYSKIKLVITRNITKTIKELVKNNNFFFIDSYNLKKVRLINKLSKNTICMGDKLERFNTKYLIDHTFMRNSKIHKFKNKNTNINSNHLYFPFLNYKKNKKTFIMINFGTFDSKKYILQSINKILNLKLHLKYKILIIDKKFNSKLLQNFKIKNVKLIRYTNNLNYYYSKTFVCFGACGISLYERSFGLIPSICKAVVKNQNYNFKGFLKKKCIVDFNSIIKDKSFSINKFYKKIKSVEQKLKIHFNPKIQKILISKLVNKIGNEI